MSHNYTPANGIALGAGFLVCPALAAHVLGFSWPAAIVAGVAVCGLYGVSFLGGRTFVRRRGL
jgi:hypothetical protein